MLTIEETIDRLNHLYLEDNIEDDYIDRIRNQQHLLLKIVANSPLASSIDLAVINTVYDQVVLSVQAFMKGNIQDSILQIKKFIFHEYIDMCIYDVSALIPMNLWLLGLENVTHMTYFPARK